MSKGGKVFTTVGLLLLAAALCLTGYNLWADAAAGSSAKNAARELQSAISRTAALAASSCSSEISGALSVK